MANLTMSSAFATRTGGARSVDNESIADVGFGVGGMQEESLAKCQDNFVWVDMTKTVTVVKVIGGCTLTLPLGEDEGGTIDVCEVNRSVKIVEMTKKG